MIGILIISHGTLGESLIHCASHMLNKRPPRLRQIGVTAQDDPLQLVPQARKMIKDLDDGEGVLVLTDMYGATPSNTLCRLLEPAHIEGVSGVNLPMLLKALNYRETLALPQLIERIVQGGRNSINHISETMCHAATGR